MIILVSGDVGIIPGPEHDPRECFSICHWNQDSLSFQSYIKVSLLTAYNLIHNFDIICVSETFLNSETAANDPSRWSSFPLQNWRCMHFLQSNASFISTKYSKSKWMHQLWGLHCWRNLPFYKSVYNPYPNARRYSYIQIKSRAKSWFIIQL